MPRYIDADRLRDSFRKSADECRNWKAEAIDDEIKARADAALAVFIDCILSVENAPAADVEEVKHGKWIDKGHFTMMCDKCEAYVAKGLLINDQIYYCPRCGAKMNREENEDV